VGWFHSACGTGALKSDTNDKFCLPGVRQRNELNLLRFTLPKPRTDIISIRARTAQTEVVGIFVLGCPQLDVCGWGNSASGSWKLHCNAPQKTKNEQTVPRKK